MPRISQRVIRISTAAAGALFFLALHADAQCGFPIDFTRTLDAPQEFIGSLEPAPWSLRPEAFRADIPEDASIVGMWKFTFISQGNLTHNPPIPDGVMLDFGYTLWHGDGTEFTNSGGRAPVTQNFCLGVWRRAARNTFQLNHFAFSYDAATGALNARVNIREEVIVAPDGNSYAGTFTIDVYAPNGSHVDHVGGKVTGQRLTVDSPIQ